MRLMVASGGVVKNPMWMKIISDVTQKPISLTTNSSNAGILGCAVLASIGSGEYSGFDEAVANMVEISSVVEPDMDEFKKYEENYQNYLQIYQQLRPIMNS